MPIHTATISTLSAPVTSTLLASSTVSTTPTVGVVERVDDGHCVLVTGADSVEMIAVYIGLLGLDFHVTEPPGLVEAVAVLGERYRRALPTS